MRHKKISLKKAKRELTKNIQTTVWWNDHQKYHKAIQNYSLAGLKETLVRANKYDMYVRHLVAQGRLKKVV